MPSVLPLSLRQVGSAGASGAAEATDLRVGILSGGLHAVHILRHDDPVRGRACVDAGRQSERRVLDRGVHGGEHEVAGCLQCVETGGVALRAFHDVRAARRARDSKVTIRQILKPANL